MRNRTQVRGELLRALLAGRRIRVVGRLGAGLDNIDVAACEAAGLPVIPATGANALSVAEYVVGTAMLLLRGAYQSTPAVAAGRWPRTALSGGREVGGKTLGLVGFGSIGQLTARLARGVGMQVVAFDAMLDEDHPAYADTGARCAGLDEVQALVGSVLQRAGATAALAQSTARALVLAESQGQGGHGLARVEVPVAEMLKDEGVRLPGARREALRRRAEAEGLDVPDALVAAWRG